MENKVLTKGVFFKIIRGDFNVLGTKMDRRYEFINEVKKQIDLVLKEI